jgi:hypothetical protein
MLQGRILWIATVFSAILLATPEPGRAVTCTTQASLAQTDRDSLVTAGGQITNAVLQQDYATLKADLLPAASAEWDGIHSVVEASATLMRGGQIQLRNLYLLDATSLTASADSQFFCSNPSGSLTVTLTMRALPPGRYAVILADATGAALSGQMSIILAWSGEGSSAGWKLAGISLRPGSLDGHDGVWYWTQARALAKENQTWSAWYSYEVARALLVPVDFLSSPNLEKLNQEQAQIRNSPQNAFPYSLADGARTWKIDSIRLDETLLHADLGVTYESTGVTDPAAQRTEATAVMTALLKAKPELRQIFYGLWAYAMKDGKPTPIMELPMAQIP